MEVLLHFEVVSLAEQLEKLEDGLDHDGQPLVLLELVVRRVRGDLQVDQFVDLFEKALGLLVQIKEMEKRFLDVLVGELAL